MRGRRNDRRPADRRARPGPGLEVLEARRLLAIFTVTTTEDNGNNDEPTSGSLRQMIQMANGSPGPDRIEFRIGGSGVRTIVPQSPLPAILDPLVIDGTTQPGYTDLPLIEITGTDAGAAVDGLRLASPATVRALTINGFSGAGLRIEASGSVVEGCFLGTDRTGRGDAGNAGPGILIDGAADNRIGGREAGQGNLISGNAGAGVLITGGQATGNRVQGNLIGTDRTGTRAIPNTCGVHLDNAGSNEIGGADFLRNVISGNDFYGILLSGPGARDNRIQGNFVGTDVSGRIAVGNGDDGIAADGASGTVIAGNLIAGNGGRGIDLTGDGTGNRIVGNRIGTNATDARPIPNGAAGVRIFGPTDTRVGGLADGAGNVIAYNGTTRAEGGVLVVGTTAGAAILSNAIYQNHGLGIDLVEPLESGATVNDPDDADSGPNGLQNHPVLAVARVGGGRWAVLGNLDGAPGTTFTLQFFSSPAGDASGIVQGRTLLGTATVATDANGHAEFRVALPGPAAVGHLMTATATDAAGNTSEFSVFRRIEAGAVTDLVVTVAGAPDLAPPGAELTYTVHVTNNGPDAATDVRVLDTLPAGAVFVAASLVTGSGTLERVGHAVEASFPTLAWGESGAFTVTIRADQPGDLTNTAVATSRDIDPDPSNNADSQQTSIRTSTADLALSLVAAPAAVLTGDAVTYTLEARNDGPFDALNAVVTARLPAGVGFVADGSTPGLAFDAATGTVTAPLGTLAPGANRPVVLRAGIGAGVAGPLALSASVASDVRDPDPANNTVTVLTPLDPADVGVTLTAPATADVGRPLRYGVRITNAGPATAAAVRFTARLPDGAAFDPAASTAGLAYDPATGTLTIDIPGLTAGSALDLGFVVTPTTLAALTTTATVTVADQPDPVPNDNAAVVTTPILTADLAVAIHGPSTLTVAEEVATYTVVVANGGPATATGAVATVLIPAGSALVSAASGSGVRTISRLGEVLVAALDGLPDGGSAQFTLTLRPTAEGTLAPAVRVTADPFDAEANNNTATARTTILGPPGVLQFAQAVIAADEGGQAVVTVERAGGARGVVAVWYEVNGGSAIPGVQYTPTGGVLIFQDGERTRTFTVPLGRDGVVAGESTIAVRLVDIGYGGLGTADTARILVREGDRDQIGPQVADVRPIGDARRITGVVLTFDEPLDPFRASDPTAYALIAGGVGRRPGAAVPVTQAAYDPARNTVTLFPGHPLPAGSFHQVVVDGATARAVTDVGGNPLDGDADGLSGGNFLASVARGPNLTYQDDDGDRVSLRLAGGGLIELVRASTGAAFRTRIEGAVASRSVLSGSVRRAGPASDGRASLGILTGLGPFSGGALSRLTSPTFSATNGPLPTAITALRFSQGPPGRGAPRWIRQ